MWEDGSPLDFTNWDENQQIVNRVTNGQDDSGGMCAEIKTSDLKWRQRECSGNTALNLYICQTRKVPKVSLISPSSGMSGGSKAGIVIGVLLVVAVVIGGAIFLVKKNKLNVSSLPSFDNSLYSSRRGQNPKQNGSHDITDNANDNPFNKANPIP